MSTFGKVLIAIAIILVVGGLSFYLLCLNHVEINEVGIAYNSIGGSTWVQEHPGWYMTSPMVKVSHISTVPFIVTIPSNAKVINSKLVRFNPKGVDEFIRLQGFSYLQDNDLQNVMLGYAFSGKTYEFMDVIQEAGPENSSTLPPLYRK